MPAGLCVARCGGLASGPSLVPSADIFYCQVDQCKGKSSLLMWISVIQLQLCHETESLDTNSRRGL